MIEAYHGSVIGSSGGFMSHFGPFLAAAQRLETLFCAQVFYAFDPKKEEIIVIDKASGMIVGQKKPLDVLDAFASYIQTARVSQVGLDIRKPLFLNDCWEDDPIGSGGLDVVAGTKGLSRPQRRSLAQLFKPFDRLIWPQDIQEKLSPERILYMKASLAADPMFADALDKRRHMLGESRFRRDEPYEIVWSFYTMKLYHWARREGFDGLHYDSRFETGTGCGFYVAFDSSQIKVRQVYTFDAAQYLQETKPIFIDRMHEISRTTAKDEIMLDVFLGSDGGQNYWKPDAAQVNPAFRAANPKTLQA